jgi:hypothetical protein
MRKKALLAELPHLLHNTSTEAFILKFRKEKYREKEKEREREKQNLSHLLLFCCASFLSSIR